MRAAALILIPATLVMAGCAKASPAASPSASSSSSAPASSATQNSASMSSSAAPAAAGQLDAVQVSGGFGQAPTVTAQWPVSVDQTLSKVLVAGSGQVVNDDSTVQVNYSGTNGRTGQVFDSNFTSGKSTTFGLTQVIPGFQKGLTGKHAGDRVLIGVASADGYAGGMTSVGIQPGDTLFFVVDIIAVS